jgi:hypothetical protein
MTIQKTAAILLLAAAWAATAGADEWDLGSDNDDAVTTDNVLFHGAEQAHDTGHTVGSGGDQDWFLLASHQYSSYQLVVDGLTGGLDFVPASVQRLVNSGTTVQQSAVALEGGGVLSLVWVGPVAFLTPTPTWVRVQGAACGIACSATDTYRVRFYETTYTVPRFNNSGTQSTVLMLQNTTDRACAATVFFLDGSGTLVGQHLVNGGVLPGHRLAVVPTATVVPNLSGSARIAHTCGYGGLSGKAVSVEPATGFTFDTALQHRPN